MRIRWTVGACVLVYMATWGGALAQTAGVLPNAGFEDGDAHWRITDGISKVCPEAARTGKMGLRAGSTELMPRGSSIHGARFAVKEDQEITLSFWARTTSKNTGMYLWFTDDKGKLIGKPPLIGIDDSKGDWKEYTFTQKAPAGAGRVNVWVHSFSKTRGFADIDDMVLSGLDADAKPMAMSAARKRPTPGPALKPEDVPRRKKPPMIVLKFDDVKQWHGDVHGRWKKLAEYLERRKIKGGFGVICQTLADAQPKYVEWIQKRREAGYVEFWYHGWDHKVHEEDGTKYNEFKARPYEAQKKRVADSQRLAKEKLGFAFTTFGPTGGTGNGLFDEASLRAVVDDPDLRVMLYPQPHDELAKRYEAGGNIQILDRVWQMNIEGAVGVPDFQRLLRGYSQKPDRTYFVLQGHPMMWNDERFSEFERIIDFLVSRGAVFMTPSECAAALAVR